MQNHPVTFALPIRKQGRNPYGLFASATAMVFCHAAFGHADIVSEKKRHRQRAYQIAHARR